MPSNPFISVIVPCFNEEAVIDETAMRLTDVLRQMEQPYEIIFINDGSRDSTLRKIELMCAMDGNTKAISFSRNFGHQAAVSAGIQHASGEVAVIIDADLQDPPQLI